MCPRGVLFTKILEDLRCMIRDMDIMCQSKLFSRNIPAYQFVFHFNHVADAGDSVIVDDGDVVYSVYTPT